MVKSCILNALLTLAKGKIARLWLPVPFKFLDESTTKEYNSNCHMFCPKHPVYKK